MAMRKNMDANTYGATCNDGCVDNMVAGVFTGETRTMTMPSIPGIGSNMRHPVTSGVSAGPAMKAGKVPTRTHS